MCTSHSFRDCDMHTCSVLVWLFLTCIQWSDLTLPLTIGGMDGSDVGAFEISRYVDRGGTYWVVHSVILCTEGVAL